MCPSHSIPHWPSPEEFGIVRPVLRRLQRLEEHAVEHVRSVVRANVQHDLAGVLVSVDGVEEEEGLGRSIIFYYK